MQYILSVLIRRTLAIACLVGSLVAVGPVVLGQAPMPLREGLKKLNQKRGTYFLYDPKLIDGQLITAKLDWKADTEPLLTQLLSGTHLAFRKVSDCYVIEPITEKVDPLPTQPTVIRRFTISGFVRERNSGEQLVGATVFVAGKSGTLTNNYGFYALSLPETDEVDLIISLVGYQRAYRRIR